MIYLIIIIAAIFIILIGSFIARKVYKKRDKKPPDEMYPMW